jgi:hypothetical protein
MFVTSVTTGEPAKKNPIFFCIGAGRKETKLEVKRKYL